MTTNEKPRLALGLDPVQTFEIVEDGGAIRCNLCGRTSWNLNDVAARYCGACNHYHEIRVRFYDDRTGKT